MNRKADSMVLKAIMSLILVVVIMFPVLKIYTNLWAGGTRKSAEYLTNIAQKVNDFASNPSALTDSVILNLDQKSAMLFFNADSGGVKIIGYSRGWYEYIEKPSECKDKEGCACLCALEKVGGSRVKLPWTELKLAQAYKCKSYYCLDMKSGAFRAGNFYSGKDNDGIHQAFVEGGVIFQRGIFDQYSPDGEDVKSLPYRIINMQRIDKEGKIIALCEYPDEAGMCVSDEEYKAYVARENAFKALSSSFEHASKTGEANKTIIDISPLRMIVGFGKGKDAISGVCNGITYTNVEKPSQCGAQPCLCLCERFLAIDVCASPNCITYQGFDMVYDYNETAGCPDIIIPGKDKPTTLYIDIIAKEEKKAVVCDKEEGLCMALKLKSIGDFYAGEAYKLFNLNIENSIARGRSSCLSPLNAEGMNRLLLGAQYEIQFDGPTVAKMQYNRGERIIAANSYKISSFCFLKAAPDISLLETIEITESSPAFLQKSTLGTANNNGLMMGIQGGLYDIEPYIFKEIKEGRTKICFIRMNSKSEPSLVQKLREGGIGDCI